MSKSIYVLACCLLMSIPLTAQTTWSAEGSGISVWVGASISTFNPDFGCKDNSPVACWNHQLLGISPYAHTNALLFNRIGAEGQARFLHWRGPGNLTESSFMAGPRVALFHKKRFIFSGKFLIGSAHISVPSPGVGSGNYLAYAPGAAVDYRLSKRLFARVDYEYQFWPSFTGTQTGSGHGGLTPNGFSVGVSYSILK
jgi:opacity protein-like surface antigen